LSAMLLLLLLALACAAVAAMEPADKGEYMCPTHSFGRGPDGTVVRGAAGGREPTALDIEDAAAMAAVAAAAGRSPGATFGKDELMCTTGRLVLVAAAPAAVGGGTGGGNGSGG
jgi:hypothetical protein